MARAFASKGATVAIVYHANDAAAEECLGLLDGEGHIAIKADVGDPTAVIELVNNAIAQLNHIDILVNNAGIGIHHPIDSSSYDQWQSAWQQTLQTNLLGPANLCYCVAQEMIKRKSGRIVNVSSRGAFRGEPMQMAYGASKAGLNSLSQSLAISLAPYNIFVGAVAPGFVNTEMSAELLQSSEGDEIRGQSPFNRVAQPEEVAHAVLFLSSEGAEFSTGTIIDVNGASYLRN